MEKIIVLLFVISYSGISFSQSLIITKTDKSTVNFKLADVDSVTFSDTSLGKASEYVTEPFNSNSVNENTSRANNSIDKATDENSKYIIQEDIKKLSAGPISYFK